MSLPLCNFSIAAVLKAISIYDWLGGPTLITDAQAEPIVWLQSNIAIDTNAGVSLDPTSIDFGSTPVVTPEPSTLLLLLPLLGLAFGMRRSPNDAEVNRAANVLEVGPDERQQMRKFYFRERTQNREANLRLVKAFAVFFLKCLAIALVVWACLQTWTERLPH